MNIFGAFTFGSLIKIFLPGFVWLIAFLILAVDVTQWLGIESQVTQLVNNKDLAQAALVLAFPISILLGLLSNVIVFMGLNDRLVRNPMRNAHPDLFALLDRLSARLRDQSWSALAWTDEATRQSFDTHIDVEIIILERLGVEKVAYLREQYWYHLEFQLNLILSLTAVFISLAVSSVLNTSPGVAIALVVIWIVMAILICGWLLKAARKNYCRHAAKMASLMAAVLSPPPQPTPGT